MSNRTSIWNCHSSWHLHSCNSSSTSNSNSNHQGWCTSKWWERMSQSRVASHSTWQLQPSRVVQQCTCTSFFLHDDEREITQPLVGSSQSQQHPPNNNSSSSKDNNSSELDLIAADCCWDAGGWLVHCVWVDSPSPHWLACKPFLVSWLVSQMSQLQYAIPTSWHSSMHLTFSNPSPTQPFFFFSIYC
jgi:hypothetical protein